MTESAPAPPATPQPAPPSPATPEPPASAAARPPATVEPPSSSARPAAQPPAPAPAPVPGTDAATRLLTDLRAEIARADSKASVLVGALGMTAGVVGALLAGRGWRPAVLSTPGTVVWWAGITALALALPALLLAVLPRYRAAEWRPGSPLSYFGDIRSAVRQGRLAEALAATDRDPAASLMAALAENSRIATRKHQWIRAGLLAFVIGAALLPAALLLG
ncbi:Pycsar system effector family protein [Streptomyces sp. NPDC090022]|uniref:Pycsar system effector family protein n=1 Tax=Streptomyces sp. NPDC090022 TaxID=3365920 RepID=UPI0037F595C3